MAKAKKHFRFGVPMKHAPSIELNPSGLYVRFQPDATIARTLIRSEWPHIALDLGEDDSVIGIEFVPVPEKFTLNTIAQQAGVKLPRRVSAADLEISPGPRRETGMATSA
jgi:hypothetical protein